MTSVKCPQCGLVYWSTAENCRRCGVTADDPTAQPDSYAQPASISTKPHCQISDADANRLLSTLKKCSRLFYFIGGMQVLAWFFIGQLLIVDAVLNIGLSYLTFRFKSRVAAILLALLTLLSVVANLLVFLIAGRGNFFIPLVLLWLVFGSARQESLVPVAGLSILYVGCVMVSTWALERRHSRIVIGLMPETRS